MPERFFAETGVEEQAAALAHEFAHMERRDYATNLLLELVALPLAWHPCLWGLRRSIAQSREMVCDRRAAGFLGTGREYARSLLRLASRMAGEAPARTIHAIGIFDANILERRVMSLTMRKGEAKKRTRLAAGAACVLLGVATCGSAMALRMEVRPKTTSPTDSKAQESATFTAPKIVFRKPPVYPAQARAEKKTLDGTVTVRVTVGEDGVPQGVELAKSLRPDYDQSALDAVKEWRFDPGLRNGKPVTMEMEININYQIYP